MYEKIFISVGANLKRDKNISLVENCLNGLKLLKGYGIFLNSISQWYKTQPVPISNQPWFVNAVINVSTSLNPRETLDSLHEIEELFGRKRKIKNEPRTLDLDIIDFEGMIKKTYPILPHPRMHLRHFVLIPLYNIAPNWEHPVMKDSINNLIEKNLSEKDKNILKIDQS